MKFKCQECNKSVNSKEWLHGDILIKEQLCADCFHFVEIIRENVGCHDTVVIDGECYRIGSAKCSHDSSRGFAGRVYKIKLKCCGFIFETSNLWSRGTVPAHFKNSLPNNAEFVK